MSVISGDELLISQNIQKKKKKKKKEKKKNLNVLVIHLPNQQRR